MSQSMRLSYQRYSDVVILDTTFKTNRFGLPLVLMAGINNEGRNQIFALALVSSESIEDFSWILTQLLCASDSK